MRLLLAVVLAAGLTGCREKPEPAEPAPAPPASVLETPLVAPMQARKRLLHDLDAQQQQARDREAAFDELTGRDR